MKKFNMHSTENGIIYSPTILLNFSRLTDGIGLTCSFTTFYQFV
jgi:hypothetical protein